MFLEAISRDRTWVRQTLAQSFNSSKFWKVPFYYDVHHKSHTMGKIIELREKYGLHMKVERYVSDETGLPEHGRMFVRE